MGEDRVERVVRESEPILIADLKVQQERAATVANDLLMKTGAFGR